MNDAFHILLQRAGKNTGEVDAGEGLARHVETEGESCDSLNRDVSGGRQRERHSRRGGTGERLGGWPRLFARTGKQATGLKYYNGGDLMEPWRVNESWCQKKGEFRTRKISAGGD